MKSGENGLKEKTTCNNGTVRWRSVEKGILKNQRKKKFQKSFMTIHEKRLLRLGGGRAKNVSNERGEAKKEMPRSDENGVLYKTGLTLSENKIDKKARPKNKRGEKERRRILFKIIRSGKERSDGFLQRGGGGVGVPKEERKKIQGRRK